MKAFIHVQSAMTVKKPLKTMEPSSSYSTFSPFTSVTIKARSLWKGQDVIVHPRIDIASIEVPDACLTKLVIGVDDSAPAIQDHNLNIIKRLRPWTLNLSFTLSLFDVTTLGILKAQVPTEIELVVVHSKLG